MWENFQPNGRELAVDYGGKAVDFLKKGAKRYFRGTNFSMAKSASGYSGTPLIRKLGIKPGMKIMVLNGPADYFSWLEEDVRAQQCKPRETPDWMHVFTADSKALEHGMQRIVQMAKANTQLTAWVSWYKKSSGIPTDITEDTIRDMALAAGLVDVKVCAINAQWSALKLVVPLAKRS